MTTSNEQIVVESGQTFNMDDYLEKQMAMEVKKRIQHRQDERHLMYEWFTTIILAGVIICITVGLTVFSLWYAWDKYIDRKMHLAVDAMAAQAQAAQQKEVENWIKMFEHQKSK